jgi:hypothetical protein
VDTKGDLMVPRSILEIFLFVTEKSASVLKDLIRICDC